jgi:hypothetical protein
VLKVPGKPWHFAVKRLISFYFPAGPLAFPDGLNLLFYFLKKVSILNHKIHVSLSFSDRRSCLSLYTQQQSMSTALQIIVTSPDKQSIPVKGVSLDNLKLPS